MTRKFRAASASFAQRAQVSRSEPKASEDHRVGERRPSGGRAKAIGLALAIGAVLCVMLAACGHYGPPVHPEPARDDAAATPATPESADDAERDRHEP